MTENLLEVDALTVAFVSGDTRTEVVSGISFAVRPGEVLALVGESGCGKSSACLALTGLLGGRSAVGGEAWFGHGKERRELLRLTPRQLRKVRGAGIAYVFQEPGASLNPVLRVRDQIAEVLSLHRPEVRDRRGEMIKLLTAVGIPAPERRLDAYPHELSGGMQQRVMIAMALAGNPRLLIADEPTTALDVTIQAQILELLDRLRRERDMALLLISHNLGVVGALADRIAVMYAGRIVESGPAATVLDSPRHPYTRALLAAVPRLGGSSGRLRTIPGTVPPPGEYPPGCRFAPRCEFRTGQCETAVPPLAEIGCGRSAACFHLAGGES